MSDCVHDYETLEHETPPCFGYLWRVVLAAIVSWWKRLVA
jgi:hypothetical protein